MNSEYDGDAISGQEWSVEEERWAKEEIKRLQAIVDKLPKTADGVDIVPGADKIWCPKNNHNRDRVHVIVEEVGDAATTHCSWCNRATEEHYSTSEAAEAAKETH